MWQRSLKPYINGIVMNNDVARPGRPACLVLFVFDESPQGTDGSQFESLPGTSGNIIQGRAASIGPHEGGPNSVGPQAAGGRLWTPLAAPSFARGHPWTPRAYLSSAGSPGSPPSCSPVRTTRGKTPGPLGGAKTCPGPRLRRPAIPSSSDQRVCPFGNPKKDNQPQIQR